MRARLAVVAAPEVQELAARAPEPAVQGLEVLPVRAPEALPERVLVALAPEPAALVVAQAWLVAQALKPVPQSVPVLPRRQVLPARHGCT